MLNTVDIPEFRIVVGYVMYFPSDYVFNSNLGTVGILVYTPHHSLSTQEYTHGWRQVVHMYYH